MKSKQITYGSKEIKAIITTINQILSQMHPSRNWSIYSRLQQVRDVLSKNNTKKERENVTKKRDI